MSKHKVRLKPTKKLPPDAGIPCIGKQILYANRVITVDTSHPNVERDLNHYKDSIDVFPEDSKVKATKKLISDKQEKDEPVPKKSKKKAEKQPTKPDPESDGDEGDDVETMTADPENQKDLTKELQDSVKVKGSTKGK